MTRPGDRPGAGLGQALDPASASELYRREMDKARAARSTRTAPSPVALAFKRFQTAAGRRAAFAAQYLVPEHDFTMLVDSLEEHLDQVCGLPDGLAAADKRALVEACMGYARSFATGPYADARASSPFAAEVAAVQQRVQERYESRAAG